MQIAMNDQKNGTIIFTGGTGFLADIPQLRSKQYGNLSPQIAARSLHGIIAIDDIRYLPK
jgi:hypothetical protein